MTFVIFAGNVAPQELVPLLDTIQRDTGCVYQSIFRGKEARGLLAKLGKHDQEFLFIHQHDPGFSPANPPGRSTHELRSDGIAYAGPPGRKLKWWQCGIDVDDPHVEAFIRAANKHGWHAHITYPTSVLEHHHVNLTKPPKYNLTVIWRALPIKLGSKGPRARWVVRTLRYVTSPKTHKTYLNPHGPAFKHVDRGQAEGIKRFQRDHHQKGDGIVGIQTYRQLVVAKRAEDKRRKAAKAKEQSEHMKTSQKGIDLIKGFEGFVDHPYKPVKGEAHWTWGYGHFGADVPSPSTGKKITRSGAEALLRRDLRAFEDVVNRLVTRPINQHRFDALVSLCYNIGPGNFASSSVLKFTNKGQFKRAAASFLLWDKGGVPLKVLPGLQKRRRAEAKLFVSK